MFLAGSNSVMLWATFVEREERGTADKLPWGGRDSESTVKIVSKDWHPTRRFNSRNDIVSCHYH